LNYDNIGSNTDGLNSGRDFMIISTMCRTSANGGLWSRLKLIQDTSKFRNSDGVSSPIASKLGTNSFLPTFHIIWNWKLKMELFYDMHEFSENITFYLFSVLNTYVLWFWVSLVLGRRSKNYNDVHIFMVCILLLPNSTINLNFTNFWTN
jgi:hypothetical protein